MEVQSTDKLFFGYSNEPKTITHILVATGVRTRAIIILEFLTWHVVKIFLVKHF